MTSLLEVHDLRKSFGKLHALDGVSLTLDERKITILIGPNGSGKTTLINVITGFYKAEEGWVRYGPTNITNWSPHKIYSAGIARTFQIPSLFWKLTVLENLLVAEKDNPGENFAKSLLKRSWLKKETQAVVKALNILELVGLYQIWNKPAEQLSGGQMKLLEIGRALMSGARLILLDEPISGVNPTLAHEIFSKILKLRDELGVTFFIVEHRLDIALSYVDHIIAMAYGKVIASGNSEIVMNDAQVIESYLGG